MPEPSGTGASLLMIIVLGGEHHLVIQIQSRAMGAFLETGSVDRSSRLRNGVK